MHECENYIEMISCMIDGELSCKDSAMLLAHIESCEQCRLIYKAFAELSSDLSSELVEPPSEMVEGVMFRINTEQIKPVHKKRAAQITAISALAACLVLAFLIKGKNGFFIGYKKASEDSAAYSMTAAEDVASEDIADEEIRRFAMKGEIAEEEETADADTESAQNNNYSISACGVPQSEADTAPDMGDSCEITLEDAPQIESSSQEQSTNDALATADYPTVTPKLAGEFIDRLLIEYPGTNISVEYYTPDEADIKAAVLDNGRELGEYSDYVVFDVLEDGVLIIRILCESENCLKVGLIPVE